MGITRTVPLFPLPEIVLFPMVRLPFHIFEPRYRAMLAEVLDGEGLIGIPQLGPDGARDAEGRPVFTRSFGVGSVEDYRTHRNGTSDIEVLGRWRVALIEEVPSAPFRRARVEVIQDAELPEGEVEPLRSILRRLLGRLGDSKPAALARDLFEKQLDKAEAPLLPVLNAFCTVLVHDGGLRQRLLETPEPMARARLLETCATAPSRRPGRGRSGDEPFEDPL